MYAPHAEWLETDGFGGFASGTVRGDRTRRYHGLLVTATTPPTGRAVLVSGCDVYVETADETYALSVQHYAPDVLHPDGSRWLAAFEPEPWPRWVFRLPDGTEISQEVVVRHGGSGTLIRWTVSGAPMRLRARLFFAGRDYHSLLREDDGLASMPHVDPPRWMWQPNADLPPVQVSSNGLYHHAPHWYRDFLYSAEQQRGLDAVEDLASPGEFIWDSTDEAVLLLSAGDADRSDDALADAERLRAQESERRATFASPLHRAADAYVVRRDSGHTIIAGYPWFTDWGRDTFIALRGLHQETKRDEILSAWSKAISNGMLPNRFPDAGEEPEYNAVDASLWFIVAVHDHLEGKGAPDAELLHAVQAILDGYRSGTRYGIRMDTDGLLAAGEPGVQLTWMDAKVGDWVVTPRIGKPVEIQALWINALRIASAWSPYWRRVHDQAIASFEDRFWCGENGWLYDVVDVDHQPGRVDDTFRPNQIFTVGGLPYPLLEGERAERLVHAVEERLVTPLGLRSLAPSEPGYRPSYEGGVTERDGAYHQGTVWPWLLAPFVEAWLRVRLDTPDARREARHRFVQPLLDHLEEAGIGHVSEIADAEPPHAPRGCPFQAWSLGALLLALRLTETH